MSYSLLDSGDEQKLEKFGPYTLIRPCAQAIWKPKKSWDKVKVDAVFSREKENKWKMMNKLPPSWIIELQGVKFKIAPTDFGHLGVFPEHSMLWAWMQEKIKTRQTPNILNLFAYSGGATLSCAQAGAKVCHLDASKGMVTWARENAELNKLQSAPIRWIVEDVLKFLQREQKRNVKYDGIILDPPSFGRGNKGEIFKIEKDIHPLLHACKSLLSNDPLFLVLTSHTPGFTPLAMDHLLSQCLHKGKVETGEMVISSAESFALPSGSFAKWEP